MVINCDRCNKKYYMRPSHYKRYKVHFCSRKCHGLSERGKDNPAWKDNEKSCPICGTVFKPTRLKSKGKQRYTIFCSRKCSGQQKSKERSREIACVICGKIKKIIRARIFKENCCSLSCTHILHSRRMSLGGNSNWRGGIGNLPWSSSFNRKLKAKIKKRDKEVCRLCGTSNNKLKETGKNLQLQIHHIDYDKQNNEMNNLISLCNHCHGKVNYNKELWTAKLSNLLLA